MRLILFAAALSAVACRSSQQTSATGASSPTLTNRPVDPAQPNASSASPVRITFVPQSDTFAVAAQEYTQLWASEGDRIVRAMESVSGLKFASSIYADTVISANVVEASSNSGYRQTPMRLRASYPPDTKKATLVHELGHRLQSTIFRGSEEEHPQLFLWVYDVWVQLYGQKFADEQVVIERRRGGPYPAAWDRR